MRRGDVECFHWKTPRTLQPTIHEIPEWENNKLISNLIVTQGCGGWTLALPQAGAHAGHGFEGAQGQDATHTAGLDGKVLAGDAEGQVRTGSSSHGRLIVVGGRFVSER